MQQVKRIQWIDNGKFLCIMFVMLHHVTVRPGILGQFYSPFFLPFFFFLSGTTHKKKTFQQFLLKKTKTILVPWFLFSLFQIVTSQILSYREQLPLKDAVYWMLLQVRDQNDTMWFLACLFVAFLPFYIIIRYLTPLQSLVLTFLLSILSILYRLWMPTDILPWGSIALPWHLQTIFVAVFFMNLGYLFHQFAEEKLKKLYTPFYGSLCFVAYLILVCISFYQHNNNLGINSFGQSIPFYYLITGLGLLLCITLSKLIKPNRFITFVGCNTLIYFGLHGKVQATLESLLQKTSLMDYLKSNTILLTIISILIVVITSLLLILPAIIIRRFFPFVIGQSYQSKVKQPQPSPSHEV